MQSKRILLSDQHFHEVVLSEKSMGVICHALDVLAMAFSLEDDYRELIRRASDSVRSELDRQCLPALPD